MGYVDSKKVHSKMANEEAAGLINSVLTCYTASLEQYFIPNKSWRQNSTGGKTDSTF